ncbi:AfsR/SARP family transcriptional regulator [Streptomyces sp. NPDC126510]|uniref:AfsR/SARP family transcriptional regulator n=1 Tax=Streptomyces sp. NPDC126510 TaxID=3155317 RepID=UPI00332F53B9
MWRHARHLCWERPSAVAGGPAVRPVRAPSPGRRGGTALDEQRLDALELRIDADLALGRAADVLPELRGLIQEYPLRENFWAQRMLALFHCARQGEALESYRDVTALLADELGVAPGAGLRRVHRRLLTATPDLIEARAVPTASPSRDVDLPVEMTSFVGARHKWPMRGACWGRPGSSPSPVWAGSARRGLPCGSPPRRPRPSPTGSGSPTSLH